ncbi:MAG: methyltransferase type 11 [Sphingomonadales bacterium]|nr:MAG: methyltransferase type 11 [Sphingomonadales bacterium]
MTRTIRLALAALALALPVPAQGAAASPGAAAQLDQLIQQQDRLPIDAERDKRDRPADVMALAGVGPGMRVLDLYSGGGYWSELFSRAVGPRGVTFAHNNAAYLGFSKDELAQRDIAHRLPGVRRLMAENNRLFLAPDSLDVVWFSLGYHDIALDQPQDGWPRIDGDQLRRTLFTALKPGGRLVIIDHRAPAGMDPDESGAKLHRIDPAAVIGQLTAAGFTLQTTSDLLVNTDDPHTETAFAPTIRGKTDRFILVFVKPKG